MREVLPARSQRSRSAPSNPLWATVRKDSIARWDSALALLNHFIW